MSEVPATRIQKWNEAALNNTGEFVLYWMTAFRRPFYNFALQRAVEHARRLQKPLLILEPLRCDYPYASERFHAFFLQGMTANQKHFQQTAAHYSPFVETTQGAAKELLEKLASSASLIVVDDHPGSILSICTKQQTLVESIDSNGLLPIRAADIAYPTAYAFRRLLQKELPGHLFDFPQKDPLAEVELPALSNLPGVLQSTPKTVPLSQLPIDHNVAPLGVQGGWKEANCYLNRFLDQRLPNYLMRSEPDRQFSSEMSPYLHCGQISTHQIVAELFKRESWTPDRLSPETKGKKSGWWGMSEATESFLDELITWREVGFNAAAFLPGYDQYHSLPNWARESLAKHRDDPRPILYRFEQFEQAATHDPLWNAAQTQLLREGRMHNYLRMLWGKKILEWSPDAETALQTMLILNDKYALDGRDPNSISGIFWCLGRYDRAWGPERPIFGKIRYMSSENTARKFSVKNYLRRYTPGKEP